MRFNKSIYAFSITILIAIFLPPNANASDINRVYGWSDYVNGEWAEYNVARRNGTPCLTEQFASVCDPKTQSLVINNVLGPCATFSGACIADIWAQDSEGIYQKGKFVGERVKPWAQYSWGDNLIPGISRAHASNLFEFTGISHRNGNLFEVLPVVSSSLKTGANAQPYQLHLLIRPVYIDKKSAFDFRKCLTIFTAQDSSPLPCWKVSPDSENRKIRVTLDLPTLPSGWVTGRITNVSMSTSESTDSNSGSLITIAGRSSTVANILKDYRIDVPADKAEWTLLSKEINMDAWDKPYSFGSYNGPDSIYLYTKLLGKFPWLDTATSEEDKWVVNFVWNPIEEVIRDCRSNSLIGYAGSNAMTFDSRIPRYNPVTNSVEYKVASPHFYSDKSIDIGQYELLINQSIAKCVWSVTAIPSAASLQVVSIDGATKVATTTIQTVGNYLRFNAAGFTFSEAKISVELGRSSDNVAIVPGEKELFGAGLIIAPTAFSETVTVTSSPSATPKPTPSPSISPSENPVISPTRSPSVTPSPTKSATKIIKCYKGANTRVVRKAPFKCPKGYTSKSSR